MWLVSVPSTDEPVFLEFELSVFYRLKFTFVMLQELKQFQCPGCIDYHAASQIVAVGIWPLDNQTGMPLPTVVDGLIRKRFRRRGKVKRQIIPFIRRAGNGVFWHLFTTRGALLDPFA